MTATPEIAEDEIFALFKAAWDTTGNVALYPNLEGAKPVVGDSWARVSNQHFPVTGSTLSGATGRTRYTRAGLFTAQVFFPTGEGLSAGRALAKIVTDAYEGKSTPSEVWFRNVRSVEVGPDGEWFQINAQANFVYDEFL